MNHSQTGAMAEWRRNGMLPLAAALGYATCVIHVYGLGVFIDAIAKDFGWSRTQVTVGMTLSTVVQAIAAIPIGLAVDRFGPRAMALVGVPLTCLAFANLGSADGTDGNWYFIWFLMSLSVLPVQAMVWTGAVASRFSASRGLALAVTLCGASVALIVFPLLGAWLIEGHGWRQAMRIEALIWGLVAWPVVILLFRGGPTKAEQAAAMPLAEEPANANEPPSMTLRQGIKTSILQRLILVGLLFTFGTIGLNVQFPSILKARGFSPMGAAATTTLIGYASIVGRLGTGMLLDRFRASLVGAMAFALPAIACLVLVLGADHVWSAGLAAVLIGFTLGAEIDVLVFLTTRYFGLRNFGGLYGGILAGLSVGTAFGPYAAAQVFDATHSYDTFIWTTFAFMVVSSLTLLSLPRPTLPKEAH